MKKLYLVLCALLLTFSAHSKILQVPEEYTTISNAISEAVDNDTILIMPGEYIENLWISNKSLFITSLFHFTSDTSYIRKTTIVNNTTWKGVIYVGHSPNMILKGLTIKGGRSELGAGIYGAVSKIEISNCIIEHNVAYYPSYSGEGAAIYAKGCNMSIKNTNIRKNSPNRNSVVYLDSTVFEMNNVIFFENEYGGFYGLVGNGVFIKNSPEVFYIKNCTFNSNRNYYNNGGDTIWSPVFEIENSVGIIENTILWDEFFVIDTNSTVSINYCNLNDDFLGNGNIYSDPMLTEQYHLLEGSPCIDAGNPDYSDPDGTRSDIGAISFNHNPKVDFKYDKISCSTPLYIQFNDYSVTNDSGDEIIEWNWDFGDGHTSIQQNPLYLFSERGEYTVKLLVKDVTNHTDSIFKTLDITGNYHVTPDTTIDILDTLELNVDSKVHSISWLEGFQQCSSTIIGLEKGVGNYNYVLSALNEFNCPIADTVNVIIENKNNISLAPQAGFSYTQLFANSDGIIVEFTDTSLVNYFGIPINYWHWDFGDGASSLDKSPIHKYVEQGRYNVTLFVRDEKDSTHQITQNICVVNTSINYIINNDTTIDILDTLILTYNSNLNSATWSCDLNECSNEIIALEKGLGEFWFHLSANNQYNCDITDSVKIKIENQSGIFYSPKAGFTYTQTEITSEGIVMEFVDTSIINYFNTPIISWEWLFGDDEYSMERNPVHLYKESGIYTVTLYVKDEQDSIGQQTQDIFIEKVGNIEREMDGIKLYPNPSKGTFILDIAEKTKINSYILYNSKGVKVYSEKNIQKNSINFNYINPGIYLIEIETYNAVFKRKVIVY